MSIRHPFDSFHLSFFYCSESNDVSHKLASTLLHSCCWVRRFIGVYQVFATK